MGSLKLFPTAVYEDLYLLYVLIIYSLVFFLPQNDLLHMSLVRSLQKESCLENIGAEVNLGCRSQTLRKWNLDDIIYKYTHILK